MNTYGDEHPLLPHWHPQCPMCSSTATIMVQLTDGMVGLAMAMGVRFGTPPQQAGRPGELEMLCLGCRSTWRVITPR